MELTGNFYESLDISLYLKEPKKRASIFPWSVDPMDWIFVYNSG
jgi:hypothetical protein